MKGLLDGKYQQSHPDAQTLSRWIRFCQRVGWYFEGTVLYEKTGLPDDALSEVDRAAIDEDYAVCKRELSRYKR